jgi:hypothetical protein
MAIKVGGLDVNSYCCAKRGTEMAHECDGYFRIAAFVEKLVNQDQ